MHKHQQVCLEILELSKFALETNNSTLNKLWPGLAWAWLGWGLALAWAWLGLGLAWLGLPSQSKFALETNTSTLNPGIPLEVSKFALLSNTCALIRS